jgi:aminomethyltransferase
MTSLKRTPLYEEHKALKARLVPFGGWEMPVQYSGVLQEHECVRQRVGIFDVSHMGEFYVTGSGAKKFLNYVTTNDLDKMYDGRCQYSLLCYENGTVVDDLIVNQIKPDHFLLVVNASNIEKDFEWLIKHKPADVEIYNASEETALFAIQGPKNPQVIRALFGSDFSDLKYYHFTTVKYQGADAFLLRTGYTGEDGFELMLPKKLAVTAWREILTKGSVCGILPIGLGARDTLRIEAAFSLYGHEINDQINALEANLGWVVKFNKSDFLGKTRLLQVKEQGPRRKIVGFEMVDAGIAREGFKIFINEKNCGHVTSGTHSPTLNKAIGLALIDSRFFALGNEFFIDVRGKMKKAKVCTTPFYRMEK